MAKVWFQLFNNEINFPLPWLAMVCYVTSLICGANHGMTHVVYDKYQSPIFGLRNDHTMLERKSAFFKHDMRASGSLDPFI